MTSDLDLTNLQRFLAHLEPRDDEAAALARALLDAGHPVVEFWGPEQMDVWRLKIRSGEAVVRFGIERGFSDGVAVARDTESIAYDAFIPAGLVIFAWARALAVSFTMTDLEPGKVPLLPHGLWAIRWAGAGHLDTAERVYRAWWDSHWMKTIPGPRPRVDEAARRALIAEGLAAMEAAVNSS
ncbi:hypothetical protein [Microbacterium testaceum]|uniref:hypothetical protein n=1 Tax=Microbacterium testaceum TaxID=2033 RepID=UPI003819545E